MSVNYTSQQLCVDDSRLVQRIVVHKFHGHHFVLLDLLRSLDEMRIKGFKIFLQEFHLVINLLLLLGSQLNLSHPQLSLKFLSGIVGWRLLRLPSNLRRCLSRLWLFGWRLLGCFRLPLGYLAVHSGLGSFPDPLNSLLPFSLFLLL